MSISNQRGTILVFLTSGIAMAAAIGIGMFYMISTQSLGQAFGSETSRAYYLALAGKDYAIANWNNAQFQHNGTVYEFVVSNTEHFSFSLIPSQITSTGIVNEGTSFEARRTINGPPPSATGS
ncbi:MAG: hypothetical protein ACXU9G_07290 [Syntrophales bacterium]